MRVAFLAAIALAAIGAQGAFAQDLAAGEGLFQQRCAFCHASGAGGAPLTEKLAALQATVIVEKMTTGTMAAMASGISDADKQSIAAFLTKNAAAAPASGGGK